MPISAPPKKTKTSISLTADVFEEAKQLAEAKKSSVSAVVEEALTLFMKATEESK